MYIEKIIIICRKKKNANSNICESEALNLFSTYVKFFQLKHFIFINISLELFLSTFNIPKLLLGHDVV